MRKTIIILIILAIIGGGVWYFYNKPKAQNTTNQDSGFKSFFSFVGKNNPDTPNGVLPDTNNQNTVGDETKKEVSPFKQLTPSAIAGYTFFSTQTVVQTPSLNPKEKPTNTLVTDYILRYVSRANGYVYEIKNSATPIQITNIYIPNIYEAFFADSSKSAILRFLREDRKTIATYSVPIPEKNPDGTRTQKNGTYLPDNISSLALSPDGGILAQVAPDKDLATLSTSTSLNAQRKELLRNPFHEWLVSWGGKNDIYLQTKASVFANGFLYQFDNKNRKLKRVLGDVPGLTASVSPLGTYVLYSESTQRGFVTKLLTTSTGVVRNIGNSILPEKCAWLKNEDLVCAGGGALDGKFPDDWYKGLVKFSDQIFKIYTKSNTFDVLYTPTETSSFDMTNLYVDEDRDLLFFVDKQTGILWQFTL